MNKETLIALGFKEVGHYTCLDSLIYKLSRNRVISVGCLGTPNELVYLCEKSYDGNYYTDLVCVHNFDYDGKLTKQKVEHLIKYFETDWNWLGVKMSRETFEKIPEIKELIDTYDFTYSSTLNKYVGFPDDDEEVRINEMWDKYQTQEA